MMRIERTLLFLATPFFWAYVKLDDMGRIAPALKSQDEQRLLATTNRMSLGWLRKLLLRSGLVSPAPNPGARISTDT